MTEHLLIVAANRPQLYHPLSQQFSGSENVKVLLDRRQGERRHQLQAREPERRRTDRRQAGKFPRSDWFASIQPERERLNPPKQRVATRDLGTPRPLRSVMLVNRIAGIILLCLGVFLSAFLGTTAVLNVLFYS